VYVGRIIGVGRTLDGRPVSAYRISSRSFPNRSAERSGGSIRIVPRPGSPDAASDSPYIAYECLVWNERFTVASNGTHTRPIFERVKAGNTPRDALVSVLAGLDREFDAYDTPRICSLFDASSNAFFLGGVTATALSVIPVEVPSGAMAYIATYEFPLPSPDRLDRDFKASIAMEACQHVIRSSIFADFEHPVCAVARMVGEGDVDVATLNVGN
jgi:IMP cyclohydrolase